MQSRAYAGLALAGLAAVLVAGTVPRSADTRVTSERRRASLMHEGSFDAVYVAGAALVAVAALEYWQQAAASPAALSKLGDGAQAIARWASVLGAHFAVNARSTDLQLVVVSALALAQPALLVHWAAIAWAYVYTNGYSAASLAAPLALLLVDAAEVARVRWWRTQAEPQSARAWPLALAALVAAAARMS
jgi:hypothetical protein